MTTLLTCCQRRFAASSLGDVRPTWFSPRDQGSSSRARVGRWLTAAALVLGLLGLGGRGAASDGPEPGPESLDVTVELVGGAPSLQVMRRSYLAVRITNNSDETLPGCTPAEFARGQPTLYLGAWLAGSPSMGLGLFEVTRQLTEPLPPGASVEVSLDVRPGVVGRRILGLGLLRTSKDGKDYAQVGQAVSVPVEVGSGSWHENHRATALRILVLLHVIVFAGALLFLSVQGLGLPRRNP